MTVMLSSQGIGLITVMAVSGCSVMLLVLGRQKFLELRKDSAGNHKEGGLGSLCSESLNSFSVVEHCISSTKNWSSISWKINWDLSEALGSVRCCETAPSSPSKDLSLSACSERSFALPSTQLVKGQRSQDNKRRNRVKKVRFSEDVVEPSGDNAEYRRRHALASASRPGHVRSQKPQNGENVSSKRVDPLTHNSEGSGRKRSPVNNQECRMQTLAKPHMPPNRMALYNGIFHDRSQRALLY
ncbi:hypothetical protein SUGI_1169100 [Cryptomeria japonica]|uniref:uncharacterized protein LOC131068717 n=1 Tax=Cryptomeria japonica TaxID=3369 RepID=UPI002414B2B7|nr:uncharacterized protein LOC131068717 [Cryptomeria japonica]GLJ54434.1 hypothetical protein SUGI_1169100 [Cryptomeria japonica]